MPSREQRGELTLRLKEQGEGGRQKGMMEGGDSEKRGGREGRQRDSCRTVTSCFSIYLIWRKLQRGLFSCELECHSIWFLCVYPHELSVLMTVSNGTLPAGSTLRDLPFWRPRTEIYPDPRTAHPPSGETDL